MHTRGIYRKIHRSGAAVRMVKVIVTHKNYVVTCLPIRTCRGLNVRLVDSFARSAYQYTHGSSVLKIAGPKDVESGNGLSRCVEMSKRRSKDAGVEIIACRAEAQSDIRGHSVARDGGLQRPCLPAISGDENRSVSCSARVGGKRRGSNLQGICRINRQIRFAIMMTLA